MRGIPWAKVPTTISSVLTHFGVELNEETDALPVKAADRFFGAIAHLGFPSAAAFVSFLKGEIPADTKPTSEIAQLTKALLAAQKGKHIPDGADGDADGDGDFWNNIIAVFDYTKTYDLSVSDDDVARKAHLAEIVSYVRSLKDRISGRQTRFKHEAEFLARLLAAMLNPPQGKDPLLVIARLIAARLKCIQSMTDAKGSKPLEDKALAAFFEIMGKDSLPKDLAKAEAAAEGKVLGAQVSAAFSRSRAPGRPALRPSRDTPRGTSREPPYKRTRFEDDKEPASGGLICTQEYAPPEQFLGPKPPSGNRSLQWLEAADMLPFGVMSFEMLGQGQPLRLL